MQTTAGPPIALLVEAAVLQDFGQSGVAEHPRVVLALLRTLPIVLLEHFLGPETLRPARPARKSATILQQWQQWLRT